MTTSHEGPDALDSRQREALSSPLRLEIFGLFTDGRPLTVAQMARLMGRSPSSLYHHVGILVEAGLLREEGVKPGAGRAARRYAPTRGVLHPLVSGDADDGDFVTRVMGSAFRMAERDLEAAVAEGLLAAPDEAEPWRVGRLHGRVRPETLQHVAHHVAEALRLLLEQGARDPRPDDRLCSLTVALLPLRNRSAGDGTASIPPSPEASS